ncbi:FAD-dependent monooxygenase [Actinokineospora auranticolor]|uniref:Putative polyketide hydroxylase/tetracenomycin A2 monooxygenase-dioxygenase n=1 Tax=Actinokineospora auranticolor TaxID=155976 RepID=A0A2S6H0Y7_9PSEU|nr:FAD-dependent monooxygenase [Actinokineospora auranticolor]PPK71124.1 putative polyketide hydroxylase/tetracenomycin A2 monooxygenase-dioxygenase [Actinokineospora auranticolor]
MELTTDVLVVGGSLNGLSTAVFLSHHGVACLVVERHPDTSRHFRFRGVSARSMELYRSAGAESAIAGAATEHQRLGGVGRAANFAADEVNWLPTPWDADISAFSPSTHTTCDQDQLEPVLRDHAVRAGAETRFGTELIQWQQDADGVRAVVEDRSNGARHTVHARYLVAADGTRSRIRDTLRIGRSGPGVLEHRMSVLFKTDVAPQLRGRQVTACIITDTGATLIPRANGLWMMTVPCDSQGLPEHRCVELIKAALGRADAQVDLVDALPWQSAALVADRFREGRVFLVGDAAHVMPPTGGFGGNTGIHDAHNLAWKLAAVLRGEADPALLDTYEQERRPVALHTMDQALARLRRWFDGDTEPRIHDDNAVMFGYRYHSAAVIEERSATDTPFLDPHHLTATPGTRAPHVNLGHGESTLDHYGPGFTLVVGPDAAPWWEAAESLRLQIHQPPIPDWSATYGVTPSGAVLVRPDGFVAWRTQAGVDSPVESLRAVLSRIGLRA